MEWLLTLKGFLDLNGKNEGLCRKMKKEINCYYMFCKKCNRWWEVEPHIKTDICKRCFIRKYQKIEYK